MPAAKKAANDAFDFAAFDIAKVTESFRELTEKSIAQGTEAYEQFKLAAEDATASAQKTFDAMRDGAAELSAKALENTKANTEASMAFIEKLTNAKTFAEAVELQGEFFRTSFETLSTQAKEAQELSVKLGEKASAPVKEATEKAVAVAEKAIKEAPVAAKPATKAA